MGRSEKAPMATKLVIQDNLWFSAKPHLGNYYRNGKTMVAVSPKLGFSASADTHAKGKELTWLSRYTGEQGSGVVIAQQWHKPGNLIDRNLQGSWIELFESAAPMGRWCIFYDPILATTQRGLVAPGEPVDFARPKVMRQFKKDLNYLRPYFDHPQYWRLNDGHPVLYVWASFALRHVEKAFAHARNQALYVLADVLGTDVVPTGANGLTGFTVATPGLERRRHRLPDLMPAFRERYAAAAATGLDFIPAGSCQYDDVTFMEARGLGEEPLQVLAANVGEVEDFLELAMSFSREIDGDRYLFWGTLNNWAEGATVLPTSKRGPRFRESKLGHYRFSHLEAIRNTMFS
jgi:hypothetical protein